MDEIAETAEEQWELGHAPLFFLGHPPHLHGHLEVRNRSDRKLKLKRVLVSGLDLETAPGTRLETLPVFAKLAPREHTKAPISLNLSPHTAPGIYKGKIHCGGKSRPLTVHILESWKLRAIPVTLSLKVPAGERVVRTVQLSNMGNMPYTLPRSAFAMLQEKGGIYHAIHASLKKAGTEGSREVLDEFVREMSEREIEPLTVKIKTDERGLQPGESRFVELELQVPENLKRHRLYLGSIDFENARVSLRLEVVPPVTNAERNTVT